MNRYILSLVGLLTLGFLACGHHTATSEGALSTIPIPAISGDAVYVVNGGDSSISVINPLTNQVLGTIAIQNGMFPHHIYLSADRASLLVAIPGVDLSAGHGGELHSTQGAVLVLEATTGKTLAATRLAMMNHNAIYSPDGTEVWTSQMMAPGQVLVLDAKTLATKQSIAVGDMPAEVTFSRDGKYAFVANGMSDSVTVIDPVTKKVVKTIPVGKNPVGPWPGSDGMMYTDNEDGMSLSAIDATSLVVVRTYALGFMPGMVATVGPSELWITNSDDGKVVFNTTTLDKKTGEVATGAGAHGLVLSADGKTAYVTNQGADTVSVLDTAARMVKATLAVGKKPNGLVFRSR